MQDSLSRVELPMPLDGLLNTVCNRYKLGYLINSTVINEGYEELNIKVTAIKGTYIVKVFSKGRNQAQINDYINGLISFSEHGVPVPKLVKHESGYLYTIMLQDKHCTLCVLEYFEGTSFNVTAPTLDDIKKIAQYVAKIHLVPLQVNPNYDTWNAGNLTKEFASKQQVLREPDRIAIEKVLADFQLINLDNLTKSVIHGDIHRAHVLKNAQGDYCILDLGCMDFNASILDIAIYLSLFAFDLDGDTNKNHEIYRAVIDEYLKIHPLPDHEIKLLPTLVAANYAAYIIAASNLKYALEDTSLQTDQWLDFGRKGLQKLPALAPAYT